MVTAPVLDHLAIGVAAWPDAYPRFVQQLGGRWSHGGPAGPFAPYQLLYRRGMKLEFIAPHGEDGFMHRFIEHDGPGPHHITFKVPSLDDALCQVGEMGIGILGGRTSMPFWHEAFLHPKACGMGTLLQLVQSDDTAMDAMLANSPTPPGFPEQQADQVGVAWIGLTTASLTTARAVLVDVLAGQVIDAGDGWFAAGWGPGRVLVVREGDVVPGGAALWRGAPELGVSHVVLGNEGRTIQDVGVDPDSVEPLPADAATGTSVWVAR